MITLTTQQNFLKAAKRNAAALKKAIIFATYQPALFLKMKSKQKVGKKSSYVGDISLDEVNQEIKKERKERKALKKSSAKSTTTSPKKRVIRAKKATSQSKKKKETTATVVPSRSTSKKTGAAGNSSSFTKWLKSTKEEESKKEKKTVLKRKIKKSNKRNDHLVTEPIAEQLVRQGYTSKAIKMYKQLQTILPEKSAYFALVIEGLRKETS